MAEPAVPVPTEAFSEKAAFAAARQSGRAVEVTSKTTPQQRVWANPSGRATAEINAVPVRLKRDGRWLDFDMTLQRRPDGTVAPRVHPGGLVLAGRRAAGEHDLATIDVVGERIGLGWSGALPEPVLAGAKATYPEVMPGVDLVLEARSVGFEQFLIVKDRSAAARVSTLRLPMRTGGGTFAARADGSGEWKTAAGKVIAQMPQAMMWDAQATGRDGERKRQMRLGVKVKPGLKSQPAGEPGSVPGEMEVSADLAWLMDPATQYPVTIDPGIVLDRGAGFDEFVQNTINLTDNQWEPLLKLGYSDDSSCVQASSQRCRARSYLRFDGLEGYRGATLYSAKLWLWENHSWSCTAYGWRATRTDWVGGGVQWGSQPAWQEFGAVSTETKGASSSCDDGWVSADIGNLAPEGIDAGSLSLVIHADGDNNRDSWSTFDHNSWKKFDSNEGGNRPLIRIEYDHIPVVSDVRLEGDATCGTGAGLRKYLPLTNTNPRFTAFVTDDDRSPMPSFNVRLRVDATPVGGGATISGESQNLAPNGTIEVRLSTNLNTSKVYTYRLVAMDLDGNGNVMNYSAWTPPCELGFDSATLDSLPVVEGLPTKVVDDVTYNLLNYGTPVLLTFRPGPNDVGEVAAYRYGFSQASVESPNATTVSAGPGGVATALVARWEIDGQGAPTTESKLYVRAVTITGNGAGASTWDADVFQDPDAPEYTPPAHVRGDLNGDGVADLAGYQPISGTEGLFYGLYGKPDTTPSPFDEASSLYDPVQLMRAPYGSSNSKSVQGDFNGDGKTDFAVFVSTGANDVALKALLSDGNALRDTEVWTSLLAPAGNPGQWNLAAMRVMAGDANGDGFDDLVVGYPGAGNWRLRTFLATNSGPFDFADPVTWATIGSDLNKIKLVIGQFDDQPGFDVAEFQDFGNCRTLMYMHESLTSGGVPTGQFHGGHQIWDSNSTSAWCWANSEFTAGRYGATGKSGIVAKYDFGGCHMGLYTFTVEYLGTPATARWFPHVNPWQSGGGVSYWCHANSELALRDLTGDGTEDVLLSYRCCGPFQQRVYSFRSSGITYNPVTGGTPPTTTYAPNSFFLSSPVEKWNGAVGPVGTGNLRWDTTTRYQLNAKFSNRCVSVFDGANGGSTADNASIRQQDCRSGYLNQNFILERHGAASLRFHVAHSPGRCLHVFNVDPGNAVPIVQYACSASGQINEAWRFEYVTGLSPTPGDPNEIAVRVISELSGRCLDVQGVNPNEGAVLQQYDCIPGQQNQIFYLRAATPPVNGLVASFPVGSASASPILADATGRNSYPVINGSAATNYQTPSELVVDGNGFARTTGPAVNSSWSFTVSAWVKLDALLTTHQTVVAQEGASYCAFYLRYNPDQRWHLELLNNINGGGFSIASAVSSVPAVSGTWVHLVGIYDQPGAAGRIYVNGVLSGSTSVGFAVPSSGPLVIGSAWSGASRQDRLAGRINDVRLWDRPLSAAEITQLHAAGAA